MSEDEGKIHAAIHAAQRKFMEKGIGKKGRHFSGFEFRRAEDVAEASSKIFDDCGIVIVPVNTTIDSTETKTGRGKIAFLAYVQVKYHIRLKDSPGFVQAASAASTMCTEGEAVNKALTLAHKFLILHMFCVPVQGMEYPDYKTGGKESSEDGEEEKKPSLPGYPDAKFLEMLPKWKGAIEDGKTASGIISTISTRYKLTEAQQGAIKSLEDEVKANENNRS